MKILIIETKKSTEFLNTCEYDSALKEEYIPKEGKEGQG